MKEQLINEFNKLGIADMEEVKELHEGKGSFVNLEFPMPCGQLVKLWDNDKTYYINQLEKFSLTARLKPYKDLNSPLRYFKGFNNCYILL